ncbi:hypothetical protein D9M69_484170 [compost metagenome]
MQVAIGSSRNSVTLDNRNRNNADRVARFLTALANGYRTNVPDAGEHELLDEVEDTLRRAITQGRGAFQVPLEDLDIWLTISRKDANYAVQLDADDVRVHSQIPLHRPAAYRELEAFVYGFVQSYRASQAA